MSRDRLVKVIALAHVATAVGIGLFWVGFHTELIFPTEVMSTRIPNFAGYLAWEKSFTIPDAVTACVMLWGGACLLRNSESRLGVTLLTAASGGLIFLGLLDFVYDVSNGMYALGHLFSWLLLAVAVCFIPLGIVTIWVLHNHGGRPPQPRAV